MNKSIIQIADEIELWYRGAGLTQKEISILTGVSQGQVSKILNGRFQHVSDNVRRLCKYSDIQVELNKNIDPSSSKILMDALLEVWDGNKATEKALAKIIRALKGLDLSPRL